ncbi:MAG: hypothetical protein ACFN4S_05075, partial [Prevotella conceptionensis]
SRSSGANPSIRVYVAAQNLFEPLKVGLKRERYPLKSGFLGAKSELLTLKNYEPATKLERQNGAKCRVCT